MSWKIIMLNISKGLQIYFDVIVARSGESEVQSPGRDFLNTFWAQFFGCYWDLNP